MTLRALVVFGTRPEAIKMAPVVRALAAAPGCEARLCVTGQHRAMLDQVLALFGLVPDHDLAVMRPSQTLPELTARILVGMAEVLHAERPDVVLVHGDTTTAFATALAAFYHGAAIAHVEAGLRTHDLRAPFPEEANRSLIGRLARWHFAPTAQARANLLREGIDPATIAVTGNTVIDALLAVRAEVATWSDAQAEAALGPELVALARRRDRRLLLVTGHRRENFGSGFEHICRALAKLAAQWPDLQVVYPVHLNPQVQGPVRATLSAVPNVHLCEPLDYAPFVWLLERAHVVLTDSGGIQEEAPALGKPVLVMRERTERPEAVQAGTVALVGADEARIVEGVGGLLGDDAAWRAMAHAANPYGDGRAAARIAATLLGESAEPFGG